MSLITNISQVRAAASINISNTLATWQPYLDEAEDTFILPCIGQRLYDELEQQAGSSASATGNFDALLTKVRKALALYALFLGADEMAVSITAAGIQVVASDNFKPAAQYQVMNLKETFLSRAHHQVDLFLKFIEENRSSFPLFVGAENRLFIRSAAEFQLQVDIHSSRRVYLSLAPIMASIEKKYIRPTISPEYFDALKDSLHCSASASINADDQLVLDLIAPAVAHLTMARALLEISIDTLDWGVFNNASNTFQSVQGKQAANRQRIAAMYEANQKDGDAEVKMLQEFLDKGASASKYALYFASNRFVGEEKAEKRSEFVNTIDRSLFIA